jgi:hypothetical protein
MSTLKNRDSSPLICKVEYAFVADILLLETVRLASVKINMQSGKAFSPIYGTPSTFNFSEPVDSSASGLLYKQKLTLYYPGLNPDVQPDLIIIERKPVVAKITFTNNQVLVIGSVDNPARIFNSLSSSDATGYAITISCDSDERARFLVST